MVIRTNSKKARTCIRSGLFSVASVAAFTSFLLKTCSCSQIRVHVIIHRYYTDTDTHDTTNTVSFKPVRWFNFEWLCAIFDWNSFSRYYTWVRAAAAAARQNQVDFRETYMFIIRKWDKCRRIKLKSNRKNVTNRICATRLWPWSPKCRPTFQHLKIELLAYSLLSRWGWVVLKMMFVYAHVSDVSCLKTNCSLVHVSVYYIYPVLTI